MVPRKNILQVAGRPLIAYTIEQAHGCDLIDRTLVSTDNQEIADVARSCGAEVPFLRPADLALDDTPMLPVLQHAVEWAEAEGRGNVRLVVVLQPTSPFRQVEDIVACIRRLDETGAESVISVCEPSHDPYRLLYRMDNADVLTPLVPREAGQEVSAGAGRAFGSRQESPQTWRETGSIYVGRRDVVMDKEMIITDDTRGVVVPVDRSLDIDTTLDLEFARWLMQRRRTQCPG